MVCPSPLLSNLSRYPRFARKRTVGFAEFAPPSVLAVLYALVSEPKNVFVWAEGVCRLVFIDVFNFYFQHVLV